MNIFVLDLDQELCAKNHCDKHVVKMIVEYGQLLSTAHRLLDGEMSVVQYINKTGKTRNKKVWALPDIRENILYKATHINHPCAVWCRESIKNYWWLSSMLGWLCLEYTARYGRVHKLQSSGLMERLCEPPKWFLRNPDKGINPTPFPLAMPDQYKIGNAVESYRAFYNGPKSRFAKWAKLNNPPEWFKPESK